MKVTILAALFTVLAAAQAPPPFGIATIAGTPYDPSGDGGPAALASVSMNGVAFRDGNLYLTDGSRVRKVGPSGIITTVIGLTDPVVHQAIPGFSGDGGPALGAKVRGVQGIVFDAAGNLYIADNGNNIIRKITASVIGGVAQPLDGSEIISTVAGTPLVVGNSNGSGPATGATLNSPLGLAIDPGAGALYISDIGNQNIRKVDAAGNITTIAGTGVAGFSGDNGPATAAQFNFPIGVTVNPATGDVYVADVLNSRVRRISAGIITTVAGTGVSSAAGNLNEGGSAAATNIQPAKLAFSGATLYILDSGVGMVRKVDGAGIITTVAGIGLVAYSGGFPPVGDGALALAAKLGSGASGVQGLVLDGLGGLFITDLSSARVRFVAGPTTSIFGQTVAAGNIATVVGPPGIVTFSGDGGPATAARLFNPGSLTLDPSGNLYFNDSGNHRLRQMDSGHTISTIAGNGVASGSPIPGPATATGIQAGALAYDLGALYFTNNNSRVLKEASGLLSIFANASGITTPPSADGTPAAQAVLAAASLAFDSAGDAYIGDTFNNLIWKVDAIAGTVSKVAGGGTTILDGVTVLSTSAKLARLFGPGTLAFDPNGNLYLNDGTHDRILKIAAHGFKQPLDGTETITIFAGNGTVGFSGDGGPATSASLNGPGGLASDAAGNVYFNDGVNFRIRRVDTNGVIATVAGTGQAGSEGDGGAATSAQIRGGGLAFDGSGNLYLSDTVNNVIRILDNTPPAISASAIKADATPYAAGTWTNQTVTVHFTCADSGSGVATCPADRVFSAEGVTTSVNGTATDNTGNSASATFGLIKIDKTAPTLNPVVNPNPVSLNGAATVSSGAADAGSGLASQSCGALATNSTGTKSVTCTATDNAGNASSATTNYIVTANGNITIQSGQSFNFVNSRIAGNVTMTGGTVVLNNSTISGNLQMSGGSLTLTGNSTVQGNMQITGGGTFLIGPGTINGNVQIQNILASAVTDQICGATVRGSLQLQNNGAAVQIGSPSCAGNSVSGNVQVTGNSAAVQIDNNSISGNLQVENNTAASAVFTNTVKGNLQCGGNNAALITGGGNKAALKQGQCASF